MNATLNGSYSSLNIPSIFKRNRKPTAITKVQWTASCEWRVRTEWAGVFEDWRHVWSVTSQVFPSTFWLGSTPVGCTTLAVLRNAQSAWLLWQVDLQVACRGVSTFQWISSRVECKQTTSTSHDFRPRSSAHVTCSLATARAPSIADFRPFCRALLSLTLWRCLFMRSSNLC